MISPCCFVHEEANECPQNEIHVDSKAVKSTAVNMLVFDELSRKIKHQSIQSVSRFHTTALRYREGGETYFVALKSRTNSEAYSVLKVKHFLSSFSCSCNFCLLVLLIGAVSHFLGKSSSATSGPSSDTSHNSELTDE